MRLTWERRWSSASGEEIVRFIDEGGDQRFYVPAPLTDRQADHIARVAVATMFNAGRDSKAREIREALQLP